MTALRDFVDRHGRSELATAGAGDRVAIAAWFADADPDAAWSILADGVIPPWLLADARRLRIRLAPRVVGAEPASELGDSREEDPQDVLIDRALGSRPSGLAGSWQEQAHEAGAYAEGCLVRGQPEAGSVALVSCARRWRSDGGAIEILGAERRCLVGLVRCGAVAEAVQFGIRVWEREGVVGRIPALTVVAHVSGRTDLLGTMLDELEQRGGPDLRLWLVECSVLAPVASRHPAFLDSLLSLASSRVERALVPPADESFWRCCYLSSLSEVFAASGQHRLADAHIRSALLAAAEIPRESSRTTALMRFVWKAIVARGSLALAQPWLERQMRMASNASLLAEWPIRWPVLQGWLGAIDSIPQGVQREIALAVIRLNCARALRSCFEWGFWGDEVDCFTHAFRTPADAWIRVAPPPTA